MSAARRAAIGFSIVPSEEMVQDMARIGEEICRKGGPIFGEKSRNRLEGFEGLLPCLEPDVNLLFAVSKTAV